MTVKVAVSALLMTVLLSRIDTAQLWAVARTASLGWLTAALGGYGLMMVVSAWRWGLLLRAQHIRLPLGFLTRSFLVATFFNNFLPSNIGGDVVRVADTAAAAGSKTLATTVVLLDRGLGLLGLVLVAAIGATMGPAVADGGPIAPAMLWSGFCAAAVLVTPTLLRPHAVIRLLQPLRAVHPTWVDERLTRLTAALARFGRAPEAVLWCFAGAVAVQAVIVGFYAAIARSMNIPIGVPELAVIVPISLIVQMIPLSMNGFGVREATFGFYFTRLGLPLESALLVSLTGAALIMLFSLTGALAYLGRRHDQVPGELRPTRPLSSRHEPEAPGEG